MVVVGYGREEGDTQTLGGRTADELSANIAKLNQDLNPVATTIGRTSLVGVFECRLLLCRNPQPPF
jgi:hypothetical protein